MRNALSTLPFCLLFFVGGTILWLAAAFREVAVALFWGRLEPLRERARILRGRGE